jgi:hypothetical protein
MWLGSLQVLWRRNYRVGAGVSGYDDDVLFIGTRFSNLYTVVDTPA